MSCCHQRRSQCDQIRSRCWALYCCRCPSSSRPLPPTMPPASPRHEPGKLSMTLRSRSSDRASIESSTLSSTTLLSWSDTWLSGLVDAYGLRQTTTRSSPSASPDCSTGSRSDLHRSTSLTSWATGPWSSTMTGRSRAGTVPPGHAGKRSRMGRARRSGRSCPQTAERTGRCWHRIRRERLRSGRARCATTTPPTRRRPASLARRLPACSNCVRRCGCRSRRRAARTPVGRRTASLRGIRDRPRVRLQRLSLYDPPVPRGQRTGVAGQPAEWYSAMVASAAVVEHQGMIQRPWRPSSGHHLPVVLLSSAT